MTLLRRILLLVAISLLPAVLIQAVNTWQAYRSRIVELRASAQREAVAAAGDLARLLEGVRQLLVTLSYVPSVRQADQPACDELFRTVTRQDPAYLNVATAAPDGRILCSAVPPAPGISAKGRPYFRALETKAFTVGEFTRGQTIPMPLIQLAVPILGDAGEATGVIWAALRLDRFQQQLERRALPPDANLTVVDRNGTVIARVPGGADMQGRALPPAFRPYLDAASPGVVELAGLNGTERIFGYVPLSVGQGLSVAVGIDRQAALAAVRGAAWRGVALIALGLVLALLAAVLGSRRFLLAPIRRLEAAAERWRAGDLRARAGLAGSSSELARLGAAFDAMAQQLEAREVERAQAMEALHGSEARFRAILEDQEEFISRFTPDFTFTFVNRAYAAQLGRPPEELVGTSLLNLMNAEQRARLKTQLAGLTPATPTVSYEMDTVLPDASSGWEHWTDRALFDAAGRVIEYQSVGRDVTESRRAEAALRASEERLRLAIEAAKLGTWNVDLVAGMRAWSDEFRAIVGLDPFVRPDPELFSGLIHPDDRDRVNERYRTVYTPAGGGWYEAEFRVRRADDGEERWVLTTGRVFFDADGNPLRAAGTIMNVTARRRTEEALRASEERLRALADNLPGGMVYQIVVEPDGQTRRFTYLSAAVERLNGVTAAAALADPGVLYGQILPEHRDRVMAAEAEAIAGGSVFDVEAPMRRPDGEVRWFRLSSAPRPQPDGRVVWDGFEIDVTERKAAEGALRESEARFRLAARAVQGIVYDLDLLTGAVWRSEGLERVIGVRHEDAPTSADWWQARVHPDDAAQVAQTARELQDGATSHLDTEYRARHADGRWVYLHDRSYVLRNESGRAVRLIGVSTDITERKRAEEHQRLLLLELSHRVKNTLAVVQSLAARSLAGERTLEQARDDFSKRLRALANAHSLLTATEWREAGLRAVVEAELRPYANRAALTGPDLALLPKAALTLALVVHELATTPSSTARWPAATAGWRSRGGSPGRPASRRRCGSLGGSGTARRCRRRRGAASGGRSSSRASSTTSAARWRWSSAPTGCAARSRSRPARRWPTPLPNRRTRRRWNQAIEGFGHGRPLRPRQPPPR
jgi:PAS domain S-box-containing protein